MNYFGDHECDSVVEYYMEDYDRWSYKIVYYVYYNDEQNMFPVFCVEPAKQGVGTGYESYTAIINNVENMYTNGEEKKNQIWRILMKGYMGSSWNDWNLECDDDFYSATKIALHSLAEGVAPEEKYVLGDRSVDGNTVEDIQRRGEKVLNVAQILYEYGLNGNEKYVKPEVEIIKQGDSSTESINNVEYFIQNYIISSNKELKSYEISIKNFPEGTIILNNKNEEVAELSNKNMKIAVPTSKITEDINGTIFINNANIKTNPIYYCESTEDGAQSYVTYNNRYEVANTQIDLEIKADKSKLFIKKIDEETEIPLANVKFEILNKNKEKIAEIITNDEGEGLIENLYPQKVYVREIKAKDGYVLNTEEKEIKLEYEKTAEVVFSNEKQKGKIKIVKEDSENKSVKLENVEFEIKDINGEIIEKLKTNKEGIAFSSDLPVGKYIVKEISTNENYILNENEEEVNVEYGKISNVVIENEAKKGKAKIVKIDKENKTKLEGVEFEILDENNNVLEKLVTNEKGEAVTKSYCIKDYKKLRIKETKTLEGYILEEKTQEVKLDPEKVQEVIFENEKKKEPELEVKKEVEVPKLPRTGC